MTSRTETYEHYLSVCNLHKKKENKLIKIIFENKLQAEPKIKYVLTNS